MDIVLQRVLSLIPKREDGKYEHGAKKQFAEKIGYTGGEIVSMWESGSSNSYLKKLHEISAVYGVSVEWLKGESEQKEKPSTTEGEGPTAEFIRLFEMLSPDEQERELAYLRERTAGRVP